MASALSHGPSMTLAGQGNSPEQGMKLLGLVLSGSTGLAKHSKSSWAGWLGAHQCVSLNGVYAGGAGVGCLWMALPLHCFTSDLSSRG